MLVFAVRDVDLSEDVETTTESLAPRLTLASPQCVPENKVIQSEVKLGELHDCIRRVREGPASLPSISLYTVVNAHQGYVAMQRCSFLIHSSLVKKQLPVLSLNEHFSIFLFLKNCDLFI